MPSNHVTKFNRAFFIIAGISLLLFVAFMVLAPKGEDNESHGLYTPSAPPESSADPSLGQKPKPVTQLSPKVQDLFSQAKMAQRQKRYVEAQALYLKIREIDPQTPGLDFPLAVIALEHREFTKAKRYLQSSIAHQDNLYTSYNLLGVVYGQEGSDAMALEQFNNAIRENAGDPVGYFNASEALRRMGQTNEAVDMLRAAIQLAPTNPLYALKMRLTRIDAGQTEVMQRAAAEELKIHPSAGDWLLTLAAVQLRLGKTAEAAANLKQAQKCVDSNLFFAMLEDNAFSRYASLKELEPFYRAAVAGTTLSK